MRITENLIDEADQGILGGRNQCPRIPDPPRVQSQTGIVGITFQFNSDAYETGNSQPGVYLLISLTFWVQPHHRAPTISLTGVCIFPADTYNCPSLGAIISLAFKSFKCQLTYKCKSFLTKSSFSCIWNSLCILSSRWHEKKSCWSE